MRPSRLPRQLAPGARLRDPKTDARVIITAAPGRNAPAPDERRFVAVPARHDGPHAVSAARSTVEQREAHCIHAAAAVAVLADAFSPVPRELISSGRLPRHRHTARRPRMKSPIFHDAEQVTAL
jgi:hypothetical protein